MDKPFITLQDAIQERIAIFDAQAQAEAEAARIIEEKNAELAAAYRQALITRITRDTGIVFSKEEKERIRIFTNCNDDGYAKSFRAEIAFLNSKNVVSPNIQLHWQEWITIQEITDPATKIVWVAHEAGHWDYQICNSHDFLAVAVFAATGREK